MPQKKSSLARETNNSTILLLHGGSGFVLFKIWMRVLAVILIILFDP